MSTISAMTARKPWSRKGAANSGVGWAMTKGPTSWNRRPGTSVPKVISDRLRNNLTPQEVKVWNWLRDQVHPVGWKFRRQVRIGPYVADFASLRPKVVIELDGDSHGTDEGKSRDRQRDAYLKAEGFEVIRFWNTEIGQKPESFVDALLARLDELGLEPSRIPDNAQFAETGQRSTNLVKRKTR